MIGAVKILDFFYTVRIIVCVQSVIHPYNQETTDE